jgi:ABC-type multidrug transport system fused ATPase/permease subunit
MLLLAAAGGIGYWSFMLFLTLGARFAEVLRQSVLADWTAHMTNTNLNHYILLYVGYTFISNVFGGTRWIWLYGVGNVGMNNRMSKVVHNLLLDRFCAAPLQFFESTPTGRLLNVVGQDIWKIDSQASEDIGRKSTSG